MAENTYSLKEMLAKIELDMREHNERSVRVEETTNLILIQAKLTNGRVTNLEKINDKRDGAVSFAKYIGLFAGGVLLTYLGWIGTQIYEINSTLSAYEISVI